MRSTAKKGTHLPVSQLSFDRISITFRDSFSFSSRIIAACFAASDLSAIYSCFCVGKQNKDREDRYSFRRHTYAAVYISPGLFTVFFLSESNNIYYKKPSIRAHMHTCQQQPITRQHKSASDKPCVSHYPSTTEEHLLVQKPLCPFLQFLPLDLLLLPMS